MHAVSITRFFNRKARGRIQHPRNRDLVSRRFQAEGTIDGLPAGQHLLLVVEVGGLMWPKGTVRMEDRSWTSQVYEGGAPPQGRFTLALYLVGGEGYDKIAGWLERGKLTGDYPGLGHIKNGVRLHSVRLHLES